MQIPAWTYSQLESYAQCPKKFYHLKVARDVADPPTEHTEWGKKVHEAMEYRIKDGTPLPEGMLQWEPLLQKIHNLPGIKFTEHKLAISHAFTPAPWGEAWSRGIVDLLVIHKATAAVLDYKTGKRKPGSNQLKLYAAYTFAHYPEINRVTTGFAWLKEKKIDRETLTRDQLPSVHNIFLPQVNKLHQAYESGKWPARPSGLCKSWCPVLTCQFNGKRGKA